jgi:hypothetical protein
MLFVKASLRHIKHSKLYLKTSSLLPTLAPKTLAPHQQQLRAMAPLQVYNRGPLALQSSMPTNARAPVEKYYENEWRVNVKGDLLIAVLRKSSTFGWTPALT